MPRPEAESRTPIRSLTEGDFYAAPAVDEVVIVDPGERAVHWYSLTDGEHRPADAGAVIDARADALAQRIDWP